MKVKVLLEDAHRIVGVMDGESCPSEDFLLTGEKSTEAMREGMMQLLAHIATNGLQNLPTAWSHEADKKNGIFEFIKGSLRLFYFKGQNGDIAVCTSGVKKSGRKADKAAVSKAAACKKAYMDAVTTNTYLVVRDEAE